jgi:uncharacterized membrane protein
VNGRLEAFCDGVFAFALTLLIVEIRPPEASAISTAPAVWSALRHLGPAVSAFLLSFLVILITWINHHNTLKLVHRNSAALLYANGLLLLGVVGIPFTTSLLGAFVTTDAAAPAVAVYDALLAVQAAGWVAITGVALRDQLAADQPAAAELRVRRANGFGAFGLYAALAAMGLWLPRTVAIITAATWLFWLVLSLRAPKRVDLAAA